MILSPEAVLCLDCCCRAFQTHPPPLKTPSCIKTTKGSQLLQLLGLVLYGLGNWLYPVGPYSKLHNFLYFFSFFFFLNNSVIWSYCLLSINSLNAAASSSELQTLSFESVLSFCFCFLMGKCWLVTPACRDTWIDWHAVTVLLQAYYSFTHNI